MRVRSGKLVLNKEGSPAPVSAKGIQHFICNLLPPPPDKCRYETLEGRQHLVIPMVILTEGVHNGSDGPLYYPPEELAKIPATWNHKPVVVYHPEINGQGVSACSPDILNNRKIGLMMNTRWDEKSKRLLSEAWIEPDRANLVDDRVMKAVTKNEMMEVSTGVFVDNDAQEGKWNKEEYIGVARNYRPDHLAVLPDQVGACSIKDGAGLLRNRSSTEGESAGRRELFVRLSKMGFKEFAKRVTNELSFDNTRAAIQSAITERLKVDPMTNYVWVCDVYSNFFIYEYDGKLYRLSYESSNTGVSLGGEDPVEVKRVTEYRSVDGSFVGNRNQTEENNMNKTQVVNEIITANAGWSETDRAALMAMDDSKLKSIHKGAVPPAPGATTNTQPQPQSGTVQAPAPAAPAAAVTTTPATATTNQNQPNVIPMTTEQYIAAAPPQVREVLQNNMAEMETEKARLIEVITSNKNHTLSLDYLKSLDLSNLRGIANLAGGPKPAANNVVPFYAGQAPVVGNNDKPVEPMSMPTMNFGKK